MDITDPEVDFVSLARGLGADGARATTPAELRAAVERAREADGPFLVDCVMDRAIPDLPF
jgi:acetolactate synthase-1/2/3 large subunit